MTTEEAPVKCVSHQQPTSFATTDQAAPMAISDYLVTDDLTILLGLISVTIFLLHNLYKPQALVHPILLGRQSDVGRVRNPGESALYRNYATGSLGRVCFQLHPEPYNPC